MSTLLLNKPDLDLNVHANNRLISKLNFLGKELEKLILKQVHTILVTELSLKKYQRGYQRFHSTKTALVKITNDVIRAMGNQQVTILSLLNFTITFNTIDHQVLLHCFSSLLNIASTALAWFHMYFSDRHQTARINGTNSTDAICHYGVPKGSVLGPVLFTMHTSLLHSIVEGHTV